MDREATVLIRCLFALALAIALLMIYRSQVAGDVLALLTQGMTVRRMASLGPLRQPSRYRDRRVHSGRVYSAGGRRASEAMDGPPRPDLTDPAVPRDCVRPDGPCRRGDPWLTCPDRAGGGLLAQSLAAVPVGLARQLQLRLPDRCRPRLGLLPATLETELVLLGTARRRHRAHGAAAPVCLSTGRRDHSTMVARVLEPALAEVAASVLVTVVSLIPWFIEAIQQPEIVPGRSGTLGQRSVAGLAGPQGISLLAAIRVALHLARDERLRLYTGFRCRRRPLADAAVHQPGTRIVNIDTYSSPGSQCPVLQRAPQVSGRLDRAGLDSRLCDLGSGRHRYRQRIVAVGGDVVAQPNHATRRRVADGAVVRCRAEWTSCFPDPHGPQNLDSVIGPSAAGNGLRQRAVPAWRARGLGLDAAPERPGRRGSPSDTVRHHHRPQTGKVPAQQPLPLRDIRRPVRAFAAIPGPMIRTLDNTDHNLVTKQRKGSACWLNPLLWCRRRNRTRHEVASEDFESSASTNFTTPAFGLIIYRKPKYDCQWSDVSTSLVGPRISPWYGTAPFGGSPAVFR